MNSQLSKFHSPFVRQLFSTNVWILVIFLGSSATKSYSQAPLQVDPYLDASQPLIYTPIALSGQIAPGTGGQIFTSFEELTTNSQGEVAFTARLNGDSAQNKGIWAGSPGSLQLLVQTGKPAAGTSNGIYYNDLTSPILGDLRRVGFTGRLTGTGISDSNDQGMWLATPTGCSIVAREGSHAPGLPTGDLFDMTYKFSFGMNPDGKFCVRSGLRGNGRDPLYNGGIWAGTPGNLQAVAYTGGYAQDPPDWKLLDGFNVSSSLINRSGQVGFEVAGGSWIGLPNALKAVTILGQQIPGLPTGTKWYLEPQISLNDRGETAFWANINNSSDFGYFMGSPGNLQLVARDKQQIPGLPSGYVLMAGSSPKISPTGEIVMPVQLSTAGSTDSSNDFLLKGTPNHLTIVAREGDHAPGTPPGVLLGNNFSFPAINSAGQIAFADYLTGAVNDSNNGGIWETDSSGVLTLVAREGGQIEVAPGDFRTINGLNLAGFSTGQDGSNRSFSDTGQLLFTAYFTDGSSGIFMASVPEPTVLVMLLSIAVGGLFIRRRKV